VKVETAVLVTGARVPLLIATEIHKAIWELFESEGPIPIYDLLQLCGNSDYQPSVRSGDAMRRYSILEDWDRGKRKAVIHDVICEVVRATVQGEGLNLTIKRKIIARVETSESR